MSMKTLKDNKFSIIIPNYNWEKYLELCINSILSQKYWNYEIIVVDWKSLDNSHKILNKYSKNIKRIKDYDKWISDAFNMAIKEVVWDYVLYLWSDDILYDDNTLYKINGYINKISKIQLDKNFNVAAPSISFYPKQWKYIKIDNTNIEFTHKNLVKYWTLAWLQNVFFNVQCLNKHKMDISKKYAMDLDLYFRLLLDNEKFIRYNSITTINIQWDNISTIYYLNAFDECLRIIWKYKHNLVDYIYIYKGWMVYYLGFLKRFILNKAKQWKIKNEK